MTRLRGREKTSRESGRNLVRRETRVTRRMEMTISGERLVKRILLNVSSGKEVIEIRWR